MYEQEIPGDAAHERVLSIVVPCYNEEESIPLFYSGNAESGQRTPSTAASPGRIRVR